MTQHLNSSSSIMPSQLPLARGALGKLGWENKLDVFLQNFIPKTALPWCQGHGAEAGHATLCKRGNTASAP